MYIEDPELRSEMQRKERRGKNPRDNCKMGLTGLGK